MATPFHDRSPCQTASYPRVRRAFTGKAPCSALSSWRLTTSGSALANQARRLSSRLLMLLMLKVATLTKSLSVFAARLVPKGASEFVFPLALFYRWKEMEKLEQIILARSGGLRSPHTTQQCFTTEAPLPVTRKEVAARLFFPPLESC